MKTFSFQVVPVIDLSDGKAVHAVGGRRAHYRPIQSILHPSSNPIAMAAAVRDSLGSREIYLADLDAIAGSPPSVEIYRALVALGLHIWVDAGVTDVESAAPLLEFEPSELTIIVGLETTAGPSTIVELVNRAGASRVMFSLDLFEGSPRIAPCANWGSAQPLELARAAIDLGVTRLLLLDLARVGTGQGSGTQNLMARIREESRSVELIVGGGISGTAEIIALRDAGATAVLVGSAIHDGRIGARDIERLAATSP
jgi:phosphoribosylformimino-5-aminoimidazole carboxamide ribotide isomerase